MTRGLLGSGFRNWIGDLRSGMNRMYILEALHRTRVFEILRDGGAMTSAQIAEKATMLRLRPTPPGHR